jgi:vacuolar protein sorting-associated protein VTA1
MKADIGPNDAVDIESVSSAYVEQFAFRVFENADNEDRTGNATRYKIPIFQNWSSPHLKTLD